MIPVSIRSIRGEFEMTTEIFADFDWQRDPYSRTTRDRFRSFLFQRIGLLWIQN